MKPLLDAVQSALMADMRSFCSGQLPSVGIFWYSPEEHVLFGVRKEELSPVQQDLANLLEQEFSLPCFDFFYDPHM